MSNNSSSNNSSFSASAPPPHVVEDCRGCLLVYSDGSTFRPADPASNFSPPLLDDGSVLWTDLVFDQAHHLHLRLYKPSSTTTTTKLPILFYFHGGGFCIGSRTWPSFHNYCHNLSSHLSALVLAPDYRLAPESRLPAAVEDGFAAMAWLGAQAEGEPHNWIGEVGDFDRVFVSGNSAGGTVAHNVAVRFGAVRIRGYVLLEPAFAGEVLTEGEREGHEGDFLSWDMLERYGRLALPIGENRDYPLVNPFGPRSCELEALTVPILAVVGRNDILKDRVEYYVTELKRRGFNIDLTIFEGQQHGFTFDPNSPASQPLMQLIKGFVTQYST